MKMELTNVKTVAKNFLNTETKYNAGCGWPSFFEAVNEDAIIYRDDHSIFWSS